MSCGGILIVEDDPDIRMALSEALESEGFDVMSAENGRIALEKLEAGASPCLIFLDLMMPEMDGPEFLLARGRNPSMAEVPVVIVSAVADRTHIPRANVSGFLRKPIDLSELIEYSEKFCDHLN